ncbi:MAG: 50S ribosomal protein L23 [Patescibacteria group bacterium]
MSNTILIIPVMTEKALKKDNVYVFQVDQKATKPQVKKIIEKMYSVTVGEIRTVVLKGKNKAVGKKRTLKKQPHKKKAYITLTKGEIVDIKVK